MKKHYPLVFLGLVWSAMLSSIGAAPVNLTNALTNQNTITNIFDDYTYAFPSNDLGGRNQTPSDGTFSASGVGLVLTTSTNFYGLYALKQPLDASNSWTATVRAFVGLFTNNQVNPWFYAGIRAYKAGTTIETTAQHEVGAKFVRHVEGSLTNEFVTKLLVRPSSTSATPVEEEYYLERQTTNGQSPTNVWLRLSYEAAIKSMRVQVSFDGTNYTTGTSWNLGTAWGLTSTNQIILAILAGNEPYGGVPATYKVKANEIYLRDLSIVSSPSSGARVLSLEGTTNLSSPWSAVSMTADQLDGSGNVNIGVSSSTSSNNFYRMRIRVQP